MFEREELLLGKDNIDKIKNKNILIVGLGGVGGMAFEMLIRSGISNITAIDYDIFEKSNLNRQILATKLDIGKKKVDVAKKRAQEINENVNVNIKHLKINEENINKLSIKYDYIIDACDDVKAKMALIKFAISNNIKIISCMGTGNKIDPTKLEITNIWKTEYDPLAKKIRQELKKEHINYKLPVVSSKEQPIKSENKIGSLSFVPNYAGMLLTNFIINDIIDN